MAHEYYAIDLPGKMLYEKEFNVTLRRTTPIEQKYILSLSQKQQKTSKEYIDFIKKLIEFDTPDMTFEELYWFDVQYILYRSRFVTFEKYPIKLTFYCNEYIEEENKICEEEVKHELNMGELIINTPDDIPDLTDKVTLHNLGEVKIRNKIINDDITIENFAKKAKIDIDDPQMRLLLLDLCLISNGKTLDELWAMADDGTITAEDIFTIEEWFKKSIWGVKEEVTIKCPKCGKEASREYVLSLEDFFSIV